MVIGVIGENCTGKSTLANAIKRTLGAEIITGRDYLRLARSESEAISLFRDKLRAAVSGDNVVYVITDPEDLSLLPKEAIRVLVSADLDTIKERFRARMRGNLPERVAQMLERRHGIFDNGTYDYRFDGAAGDTAALCAALRERSCQ